MFKKKNSLDLLQIQIQISLTVTWISNENTFKNKQQNKVSDPPNAPLTLMDELSLWRRHQPC